MRRHRRSNRRKTPVGLECPGTDLVPPLENPENGIPPVESVIDRLGIVRVDGEILLVE
jgi:hypothetical protein